MEVEPKEPAPRNAEPDLVHVLSEHPTYDVQVGDLVVLVVGDSDPFWLAEISAVGEENLDLIYWHHSPRKAGKRLIWKKHHINGACRKCDVYVRFKTKELLFTKSNSTLKTALKKIVQACLTYNEIIVPDTFK
jgi:hypothetical protein